MSSRQQFDACLKILKHALEDEIEIERKRQKKRTEWTRKWIKRRQAFGASSNLIREVRAEDPKTYRNILRMNQTQFDDLLEMVSPIIQRENTTMRMALEAEVKLQITLRYLATGDSFSTLAYMFRVPPTSISSFLPEVLSAIATVLEDYTKMARTDIEWREIGRQFNSKWQFPRCGGALDGKHIRIQRPPGSGSEFYNYKEYYSVILFALVDADYCFRYVDVGANGRCADAGIWRDTDLNVALVQKTINFPNDHVLVGDDAFPLRTDLMKPYNRTPGMSPQEKVFNYRLSRARRIVENAFGILVWRFRIFQRPINVKVETVDKIIMATCALHNWLRKIRRNIYIPLTAVDHDDMNTGAVILGEWRSQHSGLPSVGRQGSNNYSQDAESVRRAYAQYFYTDGAIPWQWKAALVSNPGEEGADSDGAF